MLLIDNKQVSVDAFIERIEELSGKKIPLAQIKANMEFTYNRVTTKFDLGIFRNNRIKQPKEKKGDDVLASFNLFDDKAGMSVSFRFASRTPYTNPNNPNVLVYDPKAIEFSGGTFSFEPREIERVIYLYCHPLCADSPVRKPGSPYKYSHNNLKAANERKKEKMNKRSEAYRHATDVHESEVKVLALGLKVPLPPNADKDDIRVALQEYAMDHPEEYLRSVENETTKFEGMIQDALNTGFITKDKNGNRTTFRFGKGKSKGEVITTVTEADGDIEKALKTHMKNNIHTYWPVMFNFNQDASADMTAEKYLRAIKEGGVDKAVVMPYVEELLLDTVVDFQTAKAYLIENHPEKGNPSPTGTKQFLKLVLSGEINDGNVKDEVGKYIRQS